MTAYETVIGLEVHVQLKTLSKAFCGCSTEFGAEPNTCLCPVCAGLPGVLPVLNRRAVEGLIVAALALDCRVNRLSIFARKQYFYPDMPKNYQITQYERPLAEKGHLDIPAAGSTRRVGILRIHLEEDAGKLLHAVGSRALDHSLVDLNRAGVPLMEIVSDPDLRAPEEAAAYLSSLRSVLRYAAVSDCDMEKGSLRCDANVSIRPVGETRLGTKVEIKNMNSIKNVQAALAYEIDRQTELVSSGGRVVQETRLWDAEGGATHPMRTKEEAHDYRYFPEPDLVPLELEEAYLESLRRSLPERPAARRERFGRDLALNDQDAGVLTAEKALADYFEAGLAVFDEKERPAAAKPLANWVINELLGRLNAVQKGVEHSPVPAGHLGELVRLVQKGTVSGKTAKAVFDEMFAGADDPREIVKKKGLAQVDDEAQIARWIDEALSAQKKAAEDFRAGRAAALGSLVGEVMKRSAGRANPSTVQRLLKEKLK